MSSKRLFVSRPTASLAALALAAGSVSCASNGRPEPWACGLAGQAIGGTAGAVAGLEIAGNDKQVGAAIGGGVGGLVLVGLAAWQTCKLVVERLDERDREEQLRRQEARERAEAREAAAAAAKQAELDRIEAERQAREAAERKARELAMAAARPPIDPNAPELVLAGAVFSTGSASLSRDAQAQLDEVATTLRKFPGLDVRITGHTDSTGSAARNLQLSQRRADSVRAYLVLKGIKTDRLQAVGQGEAVPVASNKTATGRAANRRVELDLIE